MKTKTLYRPVGEKEMLLIIENNFKKFPPRLEWQPIFYPVVQREYAEKIARDWNVPASGAGYVTRFSVEANYMRQFDEQVVGGRTHTEYWIPAERLTEFNDHVVGLIEVVAQFPEKTDR